MSYIIPLVFSDKTKTKNTDTNLISVASSVGRSPDS